MTAFAWRLAALSFGLLVGVFLAAAFLPPH